MNKILVQGLITGVAMLLVSLVFSFSAGFIFPSLTAEYVNEAIFRPWSDPLMQMFFAYPFVLGIILAFVWDKVKNSVAGKTITSRGLNFGLIYFMATTMPGMFITYSSFQVSLVLVMSWTLSGFIEAVVAGWVLAKLNK